MGDAGSTYKSFPLYAAPDRKRLQERYSTLLLRYTRIRLLMLQINDADINAITGCRSAHEAVRFWVKTASLDQELILTVPRLLRLLQQNPSRTCGIVLQKTSISIWSNIHPCLLTYYQQVCRSGQSSGFFLWWQDRTLLQVSSYLFAEMILTLPASVSSRATRCLPGPSRNILDETPFLK